MKLAIAAPLVLIVAWPAAASSAAKASCGGYSSVIYSNNRIALTLCQSQATRFTRSDLRHWQDCSDAMILIRDKTEGITIEYMDCTPTGTMQFMVRGDRFLVRHFYRRYPGFDMKPLLVESFNLVTYKKNYRFIMRFAGCDRSEVEAAKHRIDSAVAKPFDGRTYFPAVYGGLYSLRDCAATKVDRVLPILRQYENDGAFDGEVAETLDEAMDEVKLISRAAQ